MRRGCKASGDALATSPLVRFAGGTIDGGRCPPVVTRICGSKGREDIPLLLC